MSKSKDKVAANLPATITIKEYYDWHEKNQGICIVWFENYAIRFVEEMPDKTWKAFWEDGITGDWSHRDNLTSDTVFEVQEIGDMNIIRQATLDMAIKWVMNTSPDSLLELYVKMMETNANGYQ